MVIMVTIAHCGKTGRYLDKTVKCIYRTSQDPTVPSHDLTIRYRYSIAQHLAFTRPETRGTLPCLGTTLPNTPQRNFTVLYRTVTSRHDTTPRRD